MSCEYEKKIQKYCVAVEGAACYPPAFVDDLEAQIAGITKWMLSGCRALHYLSYAFH